jgi:hypothetical protein
MRLSFGQEWSPRHERALREIGSLARELAAEETAQA